MSVVSESSTVKLGSTTPDGHLNEKTLLGNVQEQGTSVIIESIERATTLPPDGGFKAWLVTLGGFCTTCCTMGYMNSFGVYQSYYASTFLAHESTSAISWIGSIQGGLISLGGIISGPLMDRYGTKAVLVPSAIVVVFSVMMTSLSRTYYQVLLAQGVLEGLASGMIYTVAMSTVGQYFVKKRALAMGCVATGASVGGIIWPIISDRLLNASTIGFGWTVRIIGFVMLALLAFASIFMREHAPRRASKFLLPGAFKDPAYVLAASAIVLAAWGMWSPIFFIVKYSTDHGVDTSRAFYIVAVLNGMSFFGRLASGFVADRAGSFNVLAIVMLCNSILLFCWTAARNYAAIVAFTAVYGLFAGAVVSLCPPCIAQVTPRPSDIGTYLGMGLALSSISVLTSGPINGAIIESHGYLASSMFSAVMVLGGATCTACARLCLDRRLWAVV